LRDARQSAPPRSTPQKHRALTTINRNHWATTLLEGFEICDVKMLGLKRLPHIPDDNIFFFRQAVTTTNLLATASSVAIRSRRRFERTSESTFSAEVLVPKHCSQTTRCHVSGNCNFHVHRRKNLNGQGTRSLQLGIPARYDLLTRALLHCCRANATQRHIIIRWYVIIRVANLTGEKSRLCDKKSGMANSVRSKQNILSTDDVTGR
jgi:hypothetical protein